jgi:pilus assembly protein CpaD
MGRLMTIFAAGSALAAVVACTPTESYWSEAQAPKVNKVEPVRLLHDVRFASGSQISAAEAAQLDGFLARHDIGYGDRVYILTDKAGTGPNAQRTTNLLNYMAAHGIKAVGLPSPEAQPGLARIVVNRYVAIPPNCPDWSKPGTADYGNTPMSNLGCSNISNLGLMVADPSELIQGRNPGPADATGSGLAIQRYRAGKVTPLDRSNTSEATAGGATK